MEYSVSRELRKKARSALRGHWQTALVTTFAAGLLDTLLRVLQVRNSPPLDIGAGVQGWIQAAAGRSSDSNVLIVLLSAASFLLSAALSVGLNYYYLRLHRGQEAVFSLLFSRIHIFGKCLGLSLMMGLLLVLWALAGMVPMVLLVLLLFRIAIGGDPTLFVSLLTIAAMIPAMIALFRYAMAPYLMADDPEIGVLEAIRQSKERMRGHKGRLLALGLSFSGWWLLVFAVVAGTSMLSLVLGTVAGLFASLGVQVYTNASVSAFYLELKGESRPLEAEVQGGVE